MGPIKRHQKGSVKPSSMTDSEYQARVHGSGFDISRICKDDFKIEHPTLISSLHDTVTTSTEEPHIPSNIEKQAEITSVIKIVNVHLNKDENGVEHNTYCYECMKINKPNMYLVVRRGSLFSIFVEFSRGFDLQDDKLLLTFFIKGCAYPRTGNGTKVVVPVLPKTFFANNSYSWNAYCEPVSGNGKYVKVFIRPPANAIVHKWKMLVSAVISKTICNFQCPGEIYILFNAWCKDDETYIERNERRMEYIINDVGLVFKGTDQSYEKNVWKYGQFEQNIIDCSLIIISDIAKIPYSQCQSAIQVAIGVRKALINPLFIDNLRRLKKCCKKEIIHKNNGSQSPLKQFFKSGMPIVNATHSLKIGIIVTVLRSLGIAARTITGFRILFSEDPSSVIDYFYSEAGHHPWRGTDVVKEYAEWVEVYLNRNDVGKEHSGWCYLDVQYGPSPVTAIKNKQSQIPYDTALVVQKLNASIVYWKVLQGDKPLKFIRKSSLRVCSKILTKKINSFEEEDISQNYREGKIIDRKNSIAYTTPPPPEKRQTKQSTIDLRAAENITLWKDGIPFLCNNTDSTARAFFTYSYNNEPSNNVSLEFCPQGFPNDVLIGNPFRATAVLSNLAEGTNYTIRIIWQVWSKITFTKRMNMITRVAKTFILNAESSVTQELVLTFNDYIKQLNEVGTFSVLCQATVLETNYDYFFENDFRVIQPELRIKLIGDLELYKKSILEVFLINTLPINIVQPKMIMAECDCHKCVFINFDVIEL
ncbi:annulin-like isoform X2 [Cimex lectularius]|uniref:Transglutaminase-like domain-containing protein n=1 Tax=Cimex lectularius TaxID=79782 RepID=A0A8I6S6L4_CIMLE|nr:annulin-like isoform X2 [Cimex lectularius]